MNYKIKLFIAQKLERPVEVFAADLNSARTQARVLIKQYPEGRVIIYEIKEIPLEEIKGEKYK